jgi:hypothetical protein
MTPTLKRLIVDAVVSAAVGFVIRKAFEILEKDMAELSRDAESDEDEV